MPSVRMITCFNLAVAAESAPVFPPGTVHLAWVGPAAPVVVTEAAGQYFVALDNGTLGSVLEGDPAAELRSLEPSRLGLASGSGETAEVGRDLLAPCAAELAAGRFWVSELGPVASSRA